MKLEDVDQAIADAKAEIARQKVILLTLQRLRLQFTGNRTHTVSKMQAATESIPPRARRDRRGRPITTDHAFAKALDARGTTIAAWAKKHRVGLPAVKSWIRSIDGRRIPRDWAERIEAEFLDEKTGESAVPATLATWKNGIR